jgi:hypothetical protein
MFPLPTNTLACVAPGTSPVAARRGNRAYPPAIDITGHDLNMSASQLPTEIVLRILDLANASSNPKLLQSCSLVCKAWSSHAQKILFRSVSISTHRGYTALVAAFRAHTPRGSKHTATRRGPHLRRSPPLSSITDIPSFLPILSRLPTSLISSPSALTSERLEYRCLECSHRAGMWWGRPAGGG